MPTEVLFLKVSPCHQAPVLMVTHVEHPFTPKLRVSKTLECEECGSLLTEKECICPRHRSEFVRMMAKTGVVV